MRRTHPTYPKRREPVRDRRSALDALVPLLLSERDRQRLASRPVPLAPFDREALRRLLETGEIQ